MNHLIGVVVVVLTASPSFAQASRTFEAPNGMMLNYVNPSKAIDFERVMHRVAEALVASSDPIHQQMAEGWHLLRAREPGPNDSILYLWWFDPAPAGANYAVSQILDDVFPDEVQTLYGQFSNAIVGGQAMVNLDHLLHFAEPPATARVSETVPLVTPPTRASSPNEPPSGSTATTIIERKCAAEWGTDFRMREHCQDQQQEALTNLRTRPMNGPDERSIRAQCSSEWPDDFRMQDYCETQQLEALANLRRQ